MVFDRATPPFHPIAFASVCAAAHLALVRALVVVISQPGSEIGLQFLDGLGDLAPERDLGKLVEDRLVEALANAVGLR